MILGGSSGFGFATAARLAADGYDLCVVYRELRVPGAAAEASLLELAKSGVRVLPFNADALRPEGVEHVLGALENARGGSQVSVLVHSIAHGSLRTVRGTDAAASDALTAHELSLTVDAMGLSLFTWVKALLSRNMLAPDTRVLALTSEGARRAWPGYAAVGAAKSVLESIVRSLAVELGPIGVRANAVQAGIANTRSLQRIGGSAELLKHAEARNPLGRVTTPEDVARAISLLCRPEAAWINGAIIPVDGGEHLC